MKMRKRRGCKEEEREGSEREEGGRERRSLLMKKR